MYVLVDPWFSSVTKLTSRYWLSVLCFECLARNKEKTEKRQNTKEGMKITLASGDSNPDSVGIPK